MHKRLRAMRKLAGFTQQELADLLGYTRGAYSHIEMGIKPMTDNLYSDALLKMVAKQQEIAHLLSLEASN